MLKRLCQIGLAAVSLLWAGASYAQGQVDFIVSGKDKGSVQSMDVNGVTYVDAQRTARKFGTNVELFAASKQIKISAKGFYAILTAPLEEVIINAETKKLKNPVISNGGKIMAPVEFFLLPSFQDAVEKIISFKDHQFIVEKRFNIAFDKEEKNQKDSLIWLSGTRPIAFSSKQVNAHTVHVTLENGVLKRDVRERPNTPYIQSYSITQERENAVLKVILGPQAKDWSFTSGGNNQFAFRAGAEKAAPVLKPAPAPVIKPEPPAEQALEPISSENAPSVLAEADEDGFVEMTPEGQTPVAAETGAENTSDPTNSVPPVAPAAGIPAGNPVIKAEPHPLSISEAHKKIRIVVDPGHGGKDAGAVRGRYREKDWNLAVGKELAKLLKKGGFDVKMTRDTDTFIALGDRAKISNNFKADLFVSIHTNASKNTKANGFQVYFRSEKATDKEAAETAALENEAMQYEEAHYNFVDALLQSLAKNEFMNESSKLSGYLQKEVYKQPGIGITVNPKTGLRQANFYVLRGVNAPSVLVEMGFISSSKDRQRLSNAQVQRKMAQGLYNGVVAYTKTEMKK